MRGETEKDSCEEYSILAQQGEEMRVDEGREMSEQVGVCELEKRSTSSWQRIKKRSRDDTRLLVSKRRGFHQGLFPDLPHKFKESIFNIGVGLG